MYLLVEVDDELPEQSNDSLGLSDRDRIESNHCTL